MKLVLRWRREYLIAFRSDTDSSRAMGKVETKTLRCQVGAALARFGLASRTASIEASKKASGKKKRRGRKQKQRVERANVAIGSMGSRRLNGLPINPGATPGSRHLVGATWLPAVG